MATAATALSRTARAAPRPWHAFSNPQPQHESWPSALQPDIDHDWRIKIDLGDWLQERLRREQPESQQQAQAERARAAHEALMSQQLEAAPAPARPALRALASALSLDAPALGRLAAAAARNARQLTALGKGWADERGAAALAALLKERARLDDAAAAELLNKCPALLRAARGEDLAKVLDVLARLEAGADSNSSDSSSSDISEADVGADGGECEQPAAEAAPPRPQKPRLHGAPPPPPRPPPPPPLTLGGLLLRAPSLANAPPATLAANLDYLTSSLQLPRGQLLKLVARHPGVLTAKPGTIPTNMGFLVGLGVTGEELRSMFAADPRWATMTLWDLTVKWQFFKAELKGTVEDLVAMPALLRLSLLDTLGPRAGLAKRKRIKLLMPSYCAGHPILSQSREWPVHRMAPVQWWMMAKPERLCSHMGIDASELAHYQQAWRVTTGDKWHQLVLSPTAGGGGGGGSGGGSAAQLVTLPSARNDDGRGAATPAAMFE